MFNNVFDARGYEKYGKEIYRKGWIRNWRKQVYWTLYLDVDVYEVEDDVTKYCEANKILIYFDGSWMHCVSDRRQYNDIMRIIEGILWEDEEDCG